MSEHPTPGRHQKNPDFDMGKDQAGHISDCSSTSQLINTVGETDAGTRRPGNHLIVQHASLEQLTRHRKLVTSVRSQGTDPVNM